MADYIAAFKASTLDMVQAGVKGMRWGVTRDRASLRAAAKVRGATSAKKESTDGKPPASSGSSDVKPKGNIQDNVESSSARYSRLESQAKSGRASDMTEQDLKFFNARTEALSKINKLTEEQPSWLRDTATKVVQQSAQRQMQGLADTLADKYIGDPIKTALKGGSGAAATSKADSPSIASVAKAAKKTVDETVEAVTKKPADETTVEAAAATASDAVKIAAAATTETTAKPALQGQTVREALADVRARASKLNSEKPSTSTKPPLQGQTVKEALADARKRLKKQN